MVATFIASAFVATFVVCCWRVWKGVHRNPTEPEVDGPPAQHWFWGLDQLVLAAKTFDYTLDFERWSRMWGGVFAVPSVLGGKRLVICDPRAIAHILGSHYENYPKSESFRNGLHVMTGPGVAYAEGDDHRRQRKLVAPAFSLLEVHNLLPVFTDCAFQLRDAWDNIFATSTSETVLIDVQDWANRYSLDTIGLAGFAHSYRRLDGNRSPFTDALDSFSTFQHGPLSLLLPLLLRVFPWLIHTPSGRLKVTRKIGFELEDAMRRVLVREKSALLQGSEDHTSIMKSLLVEGKLPSGSLSGDEIISQMKTLFLAGYETTASAITWILHELSTHEDTQEALRAELSSASEIPSFSELRSLPLLDAVLKESLRLHPATELTRVAVTDDIVPLSQPITLKDGTSTQSIHVKAGADIMIPVTLVNKSEAFWGPDGYQFKPERWLTSSRKDGNDDDDEKEHPTGSGGDLDHIHGWNHTLSFSDGPRVCIGKHFALTNIKMVIFTLVRNYRFEGRDGAKTKVERFLSLLPRGRVEGEEGYRMPIKVSKVN